MRASDGLPTISEIETRESGFLAADSVARGASRGLRDLVLQFRGEPAGKLALEVYGFRDTPAL